MAVVVVVAGVCDCDDGFSSTDCSVDVSLPPVIDGDADRECNFNDCCGNTIDITGSSFLLTDKLTCQITVCEVSVT